MVVRSMVLFNSTSDGNSTEDCPVLLFQSKQYLANTYTHDKAAQLFTVVINAVTCPLTILLNTLVIVAVKTKHQLRTNYNVVLACLAATDLLVGVIVQPLYITLAIQTVEGDLEETAYSCTLRKILVMSFGVLSISSLYHVTLVSGERYFAIKRSLSYHSIVNKTRILGVSMLAWVMAVAPFLALVFNYQILSFIHLLLGTIPRVVGTVLIIYCHITVYIEVCRHERQMIASHQVSVEAREKMLKEKKAFKTTSVIIGALLLCYTPLLVVFLLGTMSLHMTVDVTSVLFPIFLSLVILNSVLNPLIYAARNRQFRVAFIQLLLKASPSQAEEIEDRYHFGKPNTTAVSAGVRSPGQRQDGEETRDAGQGNSQRMTVPIEIDHEATASSVTASPKARGIANIVANQ